jgi:16S rRNA pseudouridine516 synthase
LLLTDDGGFNHSMSSPKRHVPKRYLATTAEPVTAVLIKALMSGVALHDEPAPLAAIECVQVAEDQLEIVLEQGKYHQVKRMLAAAGNHCAALQRIAIGQLTLDALDIAEGQWCHLEPAQLALLC